MQMRQKLIMQTSKMNKDCINDLIAVLDKHGYHYRSFKFKGQEINEQKILAIKNNPATYDAKTYSNMINYAEFEERGKDLKFLFLQMSPARKNWKINKDDIIRKYDNGTFILPDYCPDTGVMLDYGFGRNSVTKLPEFKPSWEHKDSRKLISDRGYDIEDNDITNLEIISLAANIYRNKGVFEHRAQLFFAELMRQKTYFEKEIANDN